MSVDNFTSLDTELPLTKIIIGREIWCSIHSPHNLLTVKSVSVILVLVRWLLYGSDNLHTHQLLNNLVVGQGIAMTEHVMPALCLVCEKRCDGQFYCSDACREEDRKRINDNANKENQRLLDDFFGSGKIKL